MRGSHEPLDDVELRFVARRIEHDRRGWDQPLPRDGVRLGPAGVDGLGREVEGQHRVQIVT